MAKLNYQSMTIKDIIDWCVANGEQGWLKDFVAKSEKASGKKPTYFQIKKAFATKFMPEIMPKAKEKAPTMYDLIAAL